MRANLSRSGARLRLGFEQAVAEARGPQEYGGSEARVRGNPRCDTANRMDPSDDSVGVRCEYDLINLRTVLSSVCRFEGAETLGNAA